MKLNRLGRNIRSFFNGIAEIFLINDGLTQGVRISTNLIMVPGFVIVYPSDDKLVGVELPLPPKGQTGPLFSTTSKEYAMYLCVFILNHKQLKPYFDDITEGLTNE